MNQTQAEVVKGETQGPALGPVRGWWLGVFLQLPWGSWEEKHWCARSPRRVLSRSKGEDEQSLQPSSNIPRKHLGKVSRVSTGSGGT